MFTKCAYATRHSLFPETQRQDLLALRWPSPPRNLLLLKKRQAPAVDEALAEVLKHVQSSYPLASVVLEHDVATHFHEQLEQPVYTSTDDSPTSSFALKVDLTTTLGGDGTILHGASLFSHASSVPPILSFSMGTLGFLGEWKFPEYKRALREVYVSGADADHESLGPRAGRHEGIKTKPTEQSETLATATRPSGWSTIQGKFMGSDRDARILLRNRLKVAVSCPSEVSHQSDDSNVGRHDTFAMNEVILHRGSEPHLAILEIFVGGRFLTEAVADGMIISTPTGSTAYSLSSGGSIVHPLVPSLLLTPICPRSLSFRPLVLPANTPITLRLSEKNRGRKLDVSIDGVKLDEGFSVGMEIQVRAEDVKDEHGNWVGGVPSVVRAHPGADAGSEDSWVGGLNGLLKFNYPMGEG